MRLSASSTERLHLPRCACARSSLCLTCLMEGAAFALKAAFAVSSWRDTAWACSRNPSSSSCASAASSLRTRSSSCPRPSLASMASCESVTGTDWELGNSRAASVGADAAGLALPAAL
eukprot:13119541-Alexandrium_andersonii.AAC.1